MGYELIVTWTTGEKEIHTYSSEAEAKERGNGYKMAFGNQISWTGFRPARNNSENLSD